MARISNSLSPARKGDKIVIEVGSERYWGNTIALAKADMKERNRGVVTAPSFKVWSSGTSAPPILLQENGQKQPTSALPLSVVCPLCKAGLARPCINDKGVVLLDKPHKTRILLARKMLLAPSKKRSKKK
jgi:hypothetical protein